METTSNEQPIYYRTLEMEQAWLDLMNVTPQVGIFVVSSGGMLAQRLEYDPRLRQLLIEYQAGLVRERTLLEQLMPGDPAATAPAGEVIKDYHRTVPHEAPSSLIERQKLNKS